MTSRENPRDPVSPIPPYGQADGPDDHEDHEDHDQPGKHGPVLEGVVLGGPRGGRPGPSDAPGAGRPGPSDPRIRFARMPFGAQAFGPGGAFGSGGPAGAPGHAAATVPQKSLVLAAVLAALLPPLGVFYGSFLGALTMIVLLLPVGLTAGAQGLSVLWLVGVVWAVYGAYATNHRRRAFARALGLIP
ncbi:MAG: hypothetical protein ABI746_12390 [Dermatophilaceae bacterium]